MNALYVTVSIPLLLLLAGFNHAHGLTTFGKSTSNANQAPPQTPAKPCTNHTVCRGIQGASCVMNPREQNVKSCLCGDNQPPRNGACSADYRGPHHLCTETKQCVEGAQCVVQGKNNGSGNPDKVCKCMEDLVAHNNMCSGGTPASVLSSLLLLKLIVIRTIFN